MIEFQTPQISAENVRGQPRHVHDRAARPRLRLHVRQLAAASAAVVARRRGGHERADRGRGPRVLHDQRRQGGRDRHRPQPQGDRLPDALRRGRDRGAARGHRPGRGDGGRHRPAVGRRDPQPRGPHRHAREEDQARDLPDDRPRPRLLAGRGEQDAGPADRRDPDRLDLLARQARRLLGRLRARRARRPTTTSSRSTSRPTARSTRRPRCARPPRS